MAIHSLWNKYPTIQKELIETQKIMAKAVTIRNKEMTNALHLFFQSGGKLLRPAYFLLFTSFGKTPVQKHKYQLAASLEILHAATLIHDDIIDNSPLRRDMPSIQATYGKDIAVYAGDFLFTVYFHLLSQASGTFSAIELNATNMKKILVGELDQMNLRYNTDITVKQYLQHIKGKTAQLFQLSCYEGTQFSGCSKMTQILSQQIGYRIGMAFQILDDVLDYSSSEDILHKPVMEDVQIGNYTLPLIFAMEENREAFAPLLKRRVPLTEEELLLLVANIKKYHGLAKATKLAEHYTQKALQDIKKLPDIPERKILIELTEALLLRKN